MTRDEKRAGASLAAIYALRMLGLFLILPVFAVHAKTLPGGDNFTLVGWAFGAYGVTQAFFQIPFGMASDVIGRKKVIVFGLLIFAAGSVLAAFAQDVWGLLIARVIQGAGAVSSAVTAMAADLTREQHRTKVMALIGSSIGLMFALSLVGAPVLYEWVGMSGIFWLITALVLGAIPVVLYVVPDPPPPQSGPKVPFMEVLRNIELLRLNLGIFTLHVVQMAMFMVVPGLLISTGNLDVGAHWKVYLPAVLISFVLMVPAIVLAERKGKVQPVFVASIALLLATFVMLGIEGSHFTALAGCLLSFFVAFNILEAMLPSLISRVAPPSAKGAALGVYNTTQTLGAALGPVAGGWIVQNFSAHYVFVAAAVLVVPWLVLAATMAPVPLRKSAPAVPAGRGILDNQ